MSLFTDKRKPRRYEPDLNVLIREVLSACRWTKNGCTHQATEFTLPQHEKTCSFAKDEPNELLAVLSDPTLTKQALQTQRRKNIFKHFINFSNIRMMLSPEELKEFGYAVASNSYHTPGGDEPVEPEDDSVIIGEDGQKYFKHFVLASDTLLGLSLKYGVAVEVIKSCNQLGSNNLGERCTLRIPTLNMNKPEFKEKERNQLQETLRQSLISQFMEQAEQFQLHLASPGSSSSSSSSFVFAKKMKPRVEKSEVLYYLEEHNYDFDAAINAYRGDVSWEKQQSAGSLSKACSSSKSSSSSSSSGNKTPSFQSQLQEVDLLVMQMDNFVSQASSKPSSIASSPKAPLLNIQSPGDFEKSSRRRCCFAF